MPITVKEVESAGLVKVEPYEDMITAAEAPVKEQIRRTNELDINEEGVARELVGLLSRNFDSSVAKAQFNKLRKMDPTISKSNAMLEVSRSAHYWFIQKEAITLINIKHEGIADALLYDMQRKKDSMEVHKARFNQLVHMSSEGVERHNIMNSIVGNNNIKDEFRQRAFKVITQEKGVSVEELRCLLLEESDKSPRDTKIDPEKVKLFGEHINGELEELVRKELGIERPAADVKDGPKKLIGLDHNC